MGNSYLTVKEVAQLFRVKKLATIREWIAKGLFPNTIRRGGYLIPQRDIDALIEASKVAQTPKPKPAIPPIVRKSGFVKTW